jgi:diguanylate cyclase (GGDEF)-like protein
MRGRRLALAALVLCCLAPLSARAADIVFTPKTGAFSLLPQADVADGHRSLHDVLSGRVKFVPFAHAKLTGWPVSIWVRFSMQTQERHDRRRWLILLPRSFESAVLYHDGERPVRSGMRVPFDRRPTDLYVPGFRIADRYLDGSPLYLHIVYYPDQKLIISVMDEHAFFTWSEPYRLVEGTFIGVLLAVAVFNLFVFGMMRDKSALQYVIYIIAMLANELMSTGVGDQYVWPAISMNVRIGTDVTQVLAFGAFLYFARSFLRTKEQARGWDIALIAAFAVYAVIQAVEAFTPAGARLAPSVLGVQLAAMLVTAAAGLFRWRAGYDPARFFVIAFVPSMIGVFANLYYNTFVPPGNWFWAANGVEFGTMVQAAILSFSIIDRMRILESEQRRAYRELMEVSAHAQQMQQLALIDPLTGVANRMHFAQEVGRAVERARREERKMAVLFVDLDRFKAINDRFGHRFGDDVLRIIASRLTSRLRGSDMVARLGGDEFAAILENVSSVDRVNRVASEVMRLLDDPIYIDGHIMPLGISVGHALYPDDGGSMDELLHSADLRMYRMKQEARSIS